MSQAELIGGPRWWTRFIINLNSNTCDCGDQQIFGVPPKHAGKCLVCMKADLEEWVDEWYSIEKYKTTYSHSIYLGTQNSSLNWIIFHYCPHSQYKRKGAQLCKVEEERIIRAERSGSKVEIPPISSSHYESIGRNMSCCRQLRKQPYRKRRSLQ